MLPRRILVVEDEGISALYLEARLQNLGYQSIGVADTGQDAIEMAGRLHPDLVLMDIKLKGDLDGISAGNRIQKDFDVPVVYLTAFSDQDTVARARDTAPFGYLIKPVRESALYTTIEMALEKHLLQKELQASNRALEQFATVAAHDLKSPCRQISLYLDVLLAESGSKLDSASIANIRSAMTSAKRMRELVDDLLEYSKIDRRHTPMENVSLKEVFIQVVESLRPDIEAKSACIRMANLPSVIGNRLQLGRLFENILCNALKYNLKSPVVDVGVRNDGDKVVVSVADNGIGIPAGHTEDIFEIFNRLHSESEFPGTGVGLASCKKIVELHGGRIWVESREGVGTTFFFTLPLAQSSHLAA